MNEWAPVFTSAQVRAAESPNSPLVTPSCCGRRGRWR